MEYRQLGRSGLRVSKVCVGTMTEFSPGHLDSARQVIRAAADGGLNFIDLADVYPGSEEGVGQILAEDHLRDRFVLATKGGWSTGPGPNDRGNGRAHLLDACEASLRKLRTDHIDLYYVHIVDAACPLDETLRALDDLVRQGKVRYIGTSKHPTAMIVEALWLADRLGLQRIVAEQSPYCLLDRRAENDLHFAARRFGVGLCPFWPLAQGMLSGKYAPDRIPSDSRFESTKRREHSSLFADPVFEVVRDLGRIADDVGCTLAELSLAWAMAQPGVTAPVVGMRKPEYVQSALRACELSLSADVLAEIDEVVPAGGHVADLYVKAVTAPCRTDYAAPIKGTAAIPATHPGPDA